MNAALTELHRSEILRIARQGGVWTRKALAESVGLSDRQASSVVADLLASGDLVKAKGGVRIPLPVPAPPKRRQVRDGWLDDVRNPWTRDLALTVLEYAGWDGHCRWDRVPEDQRWDPAPFSLDRVSIELLVGLTYLSPASIGRCLVLPPHWAYVPGHRVSGWSNPGGGEGSCGWDHLEVIRNGSMVTHGLEDPRSAIVDI